MKSWQIITILFQEQIILHRNYARIGHYNFVVGTWFQVFQVNPSYYVILIRKQIFFIDKQVKRHQFHRFDKHYIPSTWFQILRCEDAPITVCATAIGMVYARIHQITFILTQYNDKIKKNYRNMTRIIGIDIGGQTLYIGEWVEGDLTLNPEGFSKIVLNDYQKKFSV